MNRCNKRKEADEGEEKNMGRKNGRKEIKEANKGEEKSEKESGGACMGVGGAEEPTSLVEGRSLEVAKPANL